MSLNKASAVIKEIDEVRCRIIESGATKERIDFLQQILNHNGVETKILEVPPKEEEDPVTYSIGTPDVTFNAIVKVYNRELMTLDNHRMTADYWNQKTDKTEPNYWDRHKKDWL